MSKRTAIGDDVGGRHKSRAACQIEEKKYLPETRSQNDLDNQVTINKIISNYSQNILRTNRE